MKKRDTDLHPSFPHVLCYLSAIWYTGYELLNVSPALLFKGFLSSLRCLLYRLLAFHRVSPVVGMSP